MRARAVRCSWQPNQRRAALVGVPGRAVAFIDVYMLTYENAAFSWLCFLAFTLGSSRRLGAWRSTFRASPRLYMLFFVQKRA